MADQTSGSPTGQSSSRPVAGESPGGRPMGAPGITLITIYLIVVTIVVFHSLVVLWPPNREEPLANRVERLEQATQNQQPAGAAATAQAQPAAKSSKGEMCADGVQRRAELFWCLPLCLSEEERLFLIVMFAGALGGLVHTLRSFYWYAGCRRLVLSWAGFYITLPILGATMATVFYLVVRGGFFSPQSEVSDTSPFGFAALAALIGMFTEQAAEKLKQITETLFATAPTGTDHAGAPTVESVSPDQGPQAGGTEVTITGTGFMQGAKVTFGAQEAASVQVASGGTSISAVTPAAAEAGPVAVEVANSDGQKGSLAGGFTYV